MGEGRLTAAIDERDDPMKCRQRLYLTADRKKIVPEGDKKAASLYAVPGDEIPQESHDRFGLVDGHLKGFDPDAEAEAAAARAEQEAEDAAKAKLQPTVKAAQALYHSTAAPDTLVPKDHPDAGELYADVGDEIPQTAHDGFGLVDGHLPDFDPEFDAKAKALAAKADEDLARVEALAGATGSGASKDGGPGSDKEQKGGSDKEQKGGADKQSKPASDNETQTGAGAGDGAGAGGTAQAGVSGETV